MTITIHVSQCWRIDAAILCSDMPDWHVGDHGECHIDSQAVMTQGRHGAAIGNHGVVVEHITIDMGWVGCGVGA